MPNESTLSSIGLRVPEMAHPSEVFDTFSCRNCSVDFIRENGSNYANVVLDSILDTGMIPPDEMSISIISQKLIPGAIATNPGWHHDWWNPLTWNFDPRFQQDDFSLIVCCGTTAPTEFYIGEHPPEWDVPLEQESNPDFWNRRDTTLNEYILNGNGSVMPVEFHEVYKMDKDSIHRAGFAETNGSRILFRFTKTRKSNSNKIVHCMTSYIPSTHYQHFTLQELQHGNPKTRDSVRSAK